MKVGILRCQQTEDVCAGTTCFKSAADGSGAFTEIGSSEIVGFAPCGGCPGKKGILRANMMVKRGAEAIFLGSCMSKGNPIDYCCPHLDSITESLRKQVGEKVCIVEWTH